MHEKPPRIRSYIMWSACTILFGAVLPAALIGVLSAGGEVSFEENSLAVVADATALLPKEAKSSSAVTRGKSKIVDPYPFVPEKPSGGSTLLTKDVLRRIHESLPKRTALHVNSQSFLVADIDTGQHILEKESSRELPIASLTKLLNALVALDVFLMSDVLTVPLRATSVSGSTGLLKAGERISVNDLLHAMLMQSANDAAETLAIVYGRNQYIARMNQKARFLDADHTLITDPTGLSETNVSTAEDLLKISRYMFKERQEIVAMTRTKSYKTKNHVWVNSTKFLALSEYVGGKIGFTSAAGRTAISIFKLAPTSFATRRIVVILLKSNARDADVLSILDHIDKGALLLSRSK